MKVLVDTDVWSEAFRKRGKHSAYVDELYSLVDEGRVQLIGIIRMEILCGLRDEKTFKLLRDRLDAFPDRQLDTEIFTLAAQYHNLCRGKGIQGSNNDFIICACSVLWNLPILSKDKDYLNYQEHIPIRLLGLRGG